VQIGECRLCTRIRLCDLFAILVVRLPLGNIGKQSPDLQARKVFGDAFVGHEVVGSARLEVLWPNNGGLRCHLEMVKSADQMRVVVLFVLILLH
jgi:hypothetical protein